MLNKNRDTRIKEGEVLDVKMNGKVKWFNNEKGYGFIEYKENNDIFVHYSMINQDGYKTLNEGDEVSFELVETDKGLQAREVSKFAKTANI